MAETGQARQQAAGVDSFRAPVLGLGRPLGPLVFNLLIPVTNFERSLRQGIHCAGDKSLQTGDDGMTTLHPVVDLGGIHIDMKNPLAGPEGVHISPGLADIEPAAQDQQPVRAADGVIRPAVAVGAVKADPLRMAMLEDISPEQGKDGRDTEPFQQRAQRFTHARLGTTTANDGQRTAGRFQTLPELSGDVDRWSGCVRRR